MKKVNTLWSMLVAALIMGGCGVSASGPSGNFKIATDALPSAQIESPYTMALQAAGGTAPYSWTVKKGNWPLGVVLNSATGTIAGAPGQKGRFPITFGATDSSIPPKTTTTTLTLTVNSTQVAVTTTSLPSGAVSVPYSATLTADDGSAPYSWSVSSGKLPPGLSLQGSGAVGGTPTQAGTFSFTLEVTDSTNSTATANLSVTIAAPSSPVINSLSPSAGPTAGGAIVTITGANFASGASVTFGGMAASSVSVSSSSQIQAVAPGHVAGTVGVIVSENGQNSGSVNFTYTASQSASPTISGVSPTSGTPGTTVTITGTNFASADTVSFGGTNATASFVSATQMTAVVPSISTGTYSITVTDPDPATATLPNGFTITAAQQQPAPTTPHGNQGLLSGCSYIGSGGCSLPSGWTMVAQQDFECGSNSHAVPANPSCQTLPSTQATSAAGCSSCSTNTFETAQVHSGSYAFGGAYKSDGDQVDWIENPNYDDPAVGSFNSIYISYWEYTDPNATYPNSDYFMFLVLNNINCEGGGTSGTTFDAQSFNIPALPGSTASFFAGGQSTPSPDGVCNGSFQYNNGTFNLPMMAGQWRQVEILYTPSTTYTNGGSTLPGLVTCTLLSLPGCGNGQQEMWVNGVLMGNASNVNLNAAQPMANSMIQVGGVITDFCDAAETSRANPFTLCQSNAPTAFHRYFDDIIVIKQ